MKQFASWFTHGVGNGSELRRIVHAARTPSEALESVENFFQRQAAAKVAGLSVTGGSGPTTTAEAIAHVAAVNSGSFVTA
jgi:UDP-N-acetylmuramoylalanine-D-glutamate ligase